MTLAARLAALELLVCDVDGVLTDGSLDYGPDGEGDRKAFHVRDGLGMRALLAAGVRIAWITARGGPAVERRARELGIEHLVQGSKDKASALAELATRLGIATPAIAYVGDDLVDRDAMRAAGLAIAPADAHHEIRALAAWVTTINGGRGAVREICDAILAARAAAANASAANATAAGASAASATGASATAVRATAASATAAGVTAAGATAAGVTAAGATAAGVTAVRATAAGAPAASATAASAAAAGVKTVRATAASPAASGGLGDAEFRIVIPARMSATRLPGKPLRLLAGKPLVAHVHDRAVEAGAVEIVVATDDARIDDVIVKLGGTAMMTRADHPSGSDRIHEVVTRLGWADDMIVVNLQGDEPGMPAAAIRRVAQLLAATPGAHLATLATPIRHPRDLFDPDVVKVVLDDRGLARTFSRAPIPWARGVFPRFGATSAGDTAPELPLELPAGVPFLRHLGLYAYRVAALRTLCSTPPHPWEKAESLEQLRALALGMGIAVGIVDEPPMHGVDTEADLARAEAALRGSV